MKKTTFRFALVAVIALALGLAASQGQAGNSNAATPAPAAVSVDQSTAPELAPDLFQTARAVDDAPTCDDFGMFEHNKKDACEKSCKRGKKCVKKQMCGDGQCPDPGYCWKCSN